MTLLARENKRTGPVLGACGAGRRCTIKTLDQSPDPHSVAGLKRPFHPQMNEAESTA